MRLAWIGFVLVLCACGAGDKEHLRLAASAYLRADEADNKNVDRDLEFDIAMADFEKAVDVISDESKRYEIGGCGSTLKTFRTVRHTAMIELHAQELSGHTVTDADAKKALSKTDRYEQDRRDCYKRMTMLRFQ